VGPAVLAFTPVLSYLDVSPDGAKRVLKAFQDAALVQMSLM
jgi:hypothetical protein